MRARDVLSPMIASKVFAESDCVWVNCSMLPIIHSKTVEAMWDIGANDLDLVQRRMAGYSRRS
jgi:hypothetical protein